MSPTYLWIAAGLIWFTTCAGFVAGCWWHYVNTTKELEDVLGSTDRNPE